MITLDGQPKYVLYEGSSFMVEWYMDPSGWMRAKHYYDGLSAVEQERLDEIVKLIADSPFGTRLPRNLYNLEDRDNKIYVFKRSAYRFFNFMTAGQKIIVIDGYRKHSQAMAKKDLRLVQTVISAKNEYYLSWKNGTYYDRIPKP